MDRVKGVYKRKDGRWEARYIKGIGEDGKAKYGAVYAATREAVIAKRTETVGEKEEEQTYPTELNLLILGAGSHGRNVKEIAESFRVFKNISFLDDKAKGPDIIGTCKDALQFKNRYSCAFVAIGDNKKRKKYAKFLKERCFILPSIISPSATISPNARIGEGVAILPQSTVGDAEIGDFCILASNSLVNIDSKVGAFSHIDCGGIVLKNTRVPEGTWVKAGEVWKTGKAEDIGA